MTAEPRFSMSVRTALLATCLGLALASPGTAQTCDVPAEYSTIQSAIDDQACSVVDVAAGFYTEALAFTRSVTVLGAAGGTTVLRDAPLVATGSDVDVLLDSLRLENGCQPESLLSSGGATIDAVDVTVAYSSSFGCDRGSSGLPGRLRVREHQPLVRQRLRVGETGAPEQAIRRSTHSVAARPGGIARAQLTRRTRNR